SSRRSLQRRSRRALRRSLRGFRSRTSWRLLRGYALDRRRPPQPAACRRVTIRSRGFAVQRAGDGIRVEAVIVPVAAVVRVHPAAPVEAVVAGPAEEDIVSCSAHALVVALAEAQGV